MRESARALRDRCQPIYNPSDYNFLYLLLLELSVNSMGGVIGLKLIAIGAASLLLCCIEQCMPSSLRHCNIVLCFEMLLKYIDTDIYGVISSCITVGLGWGLFLNFYFNHAK